MYHQPKKPKQIKPLIIYKAIWESDWLSVVSLWGLLVHFGTEGKKETINEKGETNRRERERWVPEIQVIKVVEIRVKNRNRSAANQRRVLIGWKKQKLKNQQGSGRGIEKEKWSVRDMMWQCKDVSWRPDSKLWGRAP